MGRSQYSNCESEPDNMPKESSADAPVNPPAAVNPLAKPAQKSEQARLSESAAAETQAVKPPAEPTLAKQPPHLMTPLAALWPTATTPKTAVKPAASQTVKVTFVPLEPGAKHVFLCGEFNGWASDATPMQRDDAGHWETTLALAPGRYEYKFIVDGNWKHDPLAHVNVWNRNGTLNSVAQVRP
jgi:hypothetical protein